MELRNQVSNCTTRNSATKAKSLAAVLLQCGGGVGWGGGTFVRVWGRVGLLVTVWRAWHFGGGGCGTVKTFVVPQYKLGPHGQSGKTKSKHEHVSPSGYSHVARWQTNNSK